MIQLSGVTKIFTLNKKQRRDMGKDFSGHEIVAVDKVDLSCQPGRIFGLIGPNGAGKTTTLRLIATMLKPTSGKIIINHLNADDQAQEIRQRLGFLTGNTGLYDRLTAEEMVKYYADLYGMDSNQYDTRRGELFKLLDMEEFAGRRIAKLSTGMKQKVSIARTIIHNPDVVVFDEPTSGLDVMTSRAIITLIRNCRDQGKTVIFSSHRMGEIHSLCDDLAIIHKGRIYFSGTYEDFRAQMQADNLEDEFIRLTGVSA